MSQTSDSSLGNTLVWHFHTELKGKGKALNEQKIIANIRKLFDWVHSLNDMDRILLNRIEYLESKIEKLESKLKGEADEK